MDSILPQLPPLCGSLYTPHPPTHPILRDFVCGRPGSDHPDTQHHPPHTCWTPLHVYHSKSELSPENLYWKRRSDLNIKSALRVIMMEGMAMVPKNLHLSSSTGATTLLPLSPYAFLLMPNMWHFSWWKKFHLWMWQWSYFVYMDKLVYINSDSCQEAIRENQQLGSDREVTMDIT